LRGEEGDNEAPYVKQLESLLKSDKKDTVYVELAKDASILLTENHRGTHFFSGRDFYYFIY
jgi:translation initiation factor 3 subunit M